MESKLMFRWRSLLGLAVVLFLLYGLADAVAAILVPVTLQRGGAGGLGGGGVVFSGDGDNYLVGGRLASLRQSDPKLDVLLVSSMQGMCSQMMGLAILFIALTWFGLRQGRPWALWTLLLAVLAPVPYYLNIAANYSAQGAPVSSGLLGLVPFWAVPLVAFVLGWVGLRRARPASLRGH